MKNLDFSKIRILVIGDIMIDRYLEGSISGISPEADVPIFRKRASSHYLGGAANVSVNVTNLGSKAILIGLLGNDEMGETFKSILEKGQSIHDETITIPERKTTVKTRIISDKNHVLRVDTEDDSPIPVKLENILLNHILKSIKKYQPHGVLFQDYNKGILTPKIISQTIEFCNVKGIMTFVDPKFNHIEHYRSVTVFKPNKKELEYLLQDKLSTHEMLSTDILISLRERMMCTYLVVTVSEEGIIYVDDKGVHHVKGIEREIVDVCGAGDTVISVISTALSSGYSIKNAVEMANIAGGQVCEQSGVQSIDYQKLNKEYLQLRLK